MVGVVAYVAPHSYGSDDQRYVRFLEHVGDASCREKIIALQRDVLMRRSETFARLQQQASSHVALQVLERWTGVKPRALSADEQALQAEGQQLYFHLPARRLRL